MSACPALSRVRSTVRHGLTRLRPGDELRCPHCQRWHPVRHHVGEGTPYAKLMLFFACGTREYFAGTAGSPCLGTRRVGAISREVVDADEGSTLTEDVCMQSF